jgi:hypothetical protein
MNNARSKDAEGMTVERPREVRPADDRETTAQRQLAGDPREAATPRESTTQPEQTMQREQTTPRESDRARHSADARAAGPEPAQGVEHSPGDVKADPGVELWPDRAADGLRARWRDLQLHFVDDPREAAAGADAVLAETIGMLNDSLQAARADLSAWRTTEGMDTEGLRVAIQRYRTVLDRVLAL